MSKIVIPISSLIFNSKSRMESVVSGSNALVASSLNKTSGSCDSARAIATRCFWPPESSLDMHLFD